MKAVEINKTGGPEVLDVKDIFLTSKTSGPPVLFISTAFIIYFTKVPL